MTLSNPQHWLRLLRAFLRHGDNTLLTLTASPVCFLFTWTIPVKEISISQEFSSHLNDDRSELVCWDSNPAIMWLDWRLLKYPTDIRSFTWHVEVSCVVTHGGCRFWTINPASIQATPHISPSALQVILLESPSTYKLQNPAQITGSISRSAVLSLYSESVMLGLRKIKNLRWHETKGAEIPSGPWPHQQRHWIHMLWAWNYYSVVEYCSMHCFHCALSIRTLSANHISLLQHTWPDLTSKCWINRCFPTIFFYLSYICVLQPKYFVCLPYSSNRADLASAVTAKQGAFEASQVWNQQRLKHKGELRCRKAGK